MKTEKSLYKKLKTSFCKVLTHKLTLDWTNIFGQTNFCRKFYEIWKSKKVFLRLIPAIIFSSIWLIRKSYLRHEKWESAKNFRTFAHIFHLRHHLLVIFWTSLVKKWPSLFIFGLFKPEYKCLHQINVKMIHLGTIRCRIWTHDHLITSPHP